MYSAEVDLWKLELTGSQIWLMRLKGCRLDLARICFTKLVDDIRSKPESARICQCRSQGTLLLLGGLLYSIGAGCFACTGPTPSRDFSLTMKSSMCSSSLPASVTSPPSPSSLESLGNRPAYESFGSTFLIAASAQCMPAGASLSNSCRQTSLWACTLTELCP